MVACLAVAVGAHGQDPGTGSPSARPRFEVGGELRIRGEMRRGNGTDALEVDDFALSRLRLNLRLRPTRHVQAFLQVQDSRVAGLAPVRNRLRFRNPVDFRQAYVAVGRESGAATLAVGRQELDYFQGRLIGGRNWSNTTPVWDGAKLTLRGGKDSVDVIVAAHVDVRDGWDVPDLPTAVAGAVGSVRSLAADLVIEPFFLATRRPVSRARNVGGDLRTFGSRFTGILDETWDYELLLMAQSGDFDGLAKRAWSGTAGLGKTIIQFPGRPRIGFEWSYGSGDRDPLDRRSGTFDPFWISRHRHYGEQDVVSHRNLQYLNGGVRLHPSRGLEFEVEYMAHHLAMSRDGLYGANGLLHVAAPASGSGPRSVGTEIDAVVRYRPFDRVQLTVGVFRFFAGEFVRRNIPDGGSQTFLYTALVVRL